MVENLISKFEIKIAVIGLIALTISTQLLVYVPISSDNPEKADIQTIEPFQPNMNVSIVEFGGGGSVGGGTDEGSGLPVVDLVAGGIWNVLGAISDFINAILGIMLTVFGYFKYVFTNWFILLDNAGWASMFIVIPQIVMVLSVANIMVKFFGIFAQSLPFT